MAEVDSLTEKFSELSYEEQTQFIRTLRERRRTRPVSVKAQRKAAKGKRDTSAKISGSTKNISPDALINHMSAEDKLRLLREMGVDV